jgi:hypothetical protein
VGVGKTVIVALLLVLVQRVVLGFWADICVGRTVDVALRLADSSAAGVGATLEEHGVLDEIGPIVGLGTSVLDVNARAYLGLNDSDAGTYIEAEGAG